MGSFDGPVYRVSNAADVRTAEREALVVAWVRRWDEGGARSDRSGRVGGGGSGGDGGDGGKRFAGCC